MIESLVAVLKSGVEDEGEVLRNLVNVLAIESRSVKVKNAAKKKHVDLCGKSSPFYAKINGQFYTEASVANMCMSHLNLEGYDLIVEPSAGHGDFYKLFPTDKETFAIDIDPKCPGVTEGSFFDYIPPQRLGNIAVIGNPPFGKNASLAVDFIKHSSKFADMIAFILPRTFRKPSIINKIPRNFWLEKEVEIPKNSFYIETDEGMEEFDLRCVFQVWKKRSALREVIVEESEHADFSFVKKGNADFAIRRAGNRAGEVYTEIEEVAIQGNYFIKSNAENVKETFISAWERELNPEVDRGMTGFKYDSAGQATISQPELVKTYKKYRQFFINRTK